MQLESVCSIPVDELLLTRAVFTADGHQILIGHKDLALYDILSGKAVRKFPFEAFIASAAFSSDGRFLACVNENDNHPGTAGLAKVFDVDTGRTLLEVRTRFPVEAGCLLDTPGGTLFLCKEAVMEQSDGLPPLRRNRLRAFRLPAADPLPPLDLPGWEVRALAADAGGIVLLGTEAAGTTLEIEGANLTFRQFKLGTYSYPEGVPARVHPLGIGIGASGFSDDGRLAALEVVDFKANTRHLAIVDVETGLEAALLPLPSNVIAAFTFSQGGPVFAALSEGPDGAGNTLRLWDTESLKQIGQTSIGFQYHAIALNWPTRRFAALGGGKCDIGLIHT